VPRLGLVRSADIEVAIPTGVVSSTPSTRSSTDEHLYALAVEIASLAPELSTTQVDELKRLVSSSSK
jgi:hypothetical protein